MQSVVLRGAPASPGLSQDLGLPSDFPHVLVVDDREPLRDLYAWALQSWGYHPQCVANGQEAMTWIESGHMPIVILLDLLMPVMDGSTFLAHLRRRAWRKAPIELPPVILLTVDKSSHKELDCNFVLYKPFPLHYLRDVLQDLSLLGSLPY